MKTIKTLVCGLLAVVLALAFSACDNGTEPGPVNPTATVTSVTVTPKTSTSVEKGNSIEFDVEVKGTGDYSQDVIWSIVETGKHVDTNIDANGKLTVVSAETLTTLTVKATSTADSTKSGTIEVQVYEAGQLPTVASVTVTPSTATIAKGGYQEFSATVAGTNNPAQTVIWSIVQTNKNAATIIDADGRLIVAANETLNSLTVKAMSTVDVTKSGEATVTLTAPAGKILSITGINNNISGGRGVMLLSSLTPPTVVARGEGVIVNGTLTLTLYEADDSSDSGSSDPGQGDSGSPTGWNGSGQYFVVLGDEMSGMYIYTNNTNISGSWTSVTAKVNFTQAGTSIAFSAFREIIFGEGGTQLTITGLESFNSTGATVYVRDNPDRGGRRVAVGRGTISEGSVTVSLTDDETLEGWAESGQYWIWLRIQVTEWEKHFYYTNGQTLQELGIYSDDDLDKLPKYPFDGTDKSIAFNLFCDEDQSGQTNTLNSISLNHTTVKKTYIQNETLDLSGLVVTANYSDGSSEVTDYSSDPAHGETLSTTGEITVTVSYTEGTVTETADFAVTVFSSGDVITVTSTAEWDAAKTTISNGGNNQSYIIHVSGNIGVEGSANNTFGNVSGLSVTLTGNGKLYLTSQGSIVRIGANQTLVIDSAGLTLQGRKNGQNGATGDNNRSVVHITGNNAKMELRNGTISGNTSSSDGGGVYVDDNTTFTMSGGEISGNISSTYSTGGGGVAIEDGTFTMSGGKISGNTARGNGGGVNMLDGGTFTMSGGEISGNTTEEGSGGLYGFGGGVLATTFTMSGTAKISDNTAVYGGGVAATGTFTMSGTAKISGNTADDGGGVCVFDAFTMSGGELSGNTAHGDGGGVYVFTGTIIMDGYGHVANGIFRIVNGTVYGSNVIPANLRNTATNGDSLYNDSTAQRGTFSGSIWNSLGTLDTTNDTIRVVNGVQQ